MKMFLIVFLLTFLIFASLTGRPASAFLGGLFGGGGHGVGGSVHVVLDTSPTSIIRTAKDIVMAASSAITAMETTHLAVYTTIIKPLKTKIEETLKRSVWKSLSNEALKWIQGKGEKGMAGAGPKFVSDLEGYLYGRKNIQGLDSALVSREGSQYCEELRPRYKYFVEDAYQQMAGSNSGDMCALNEEAGSWKDYCSDWDNGGSDAFLSMVTNPYNSWQGATANAISDVYQEEGQKEHMQELKYVANQGWKPTEKKGACLLKDAHGNCLKWQTLITSPGTVARDVLSSTINSGFNSILNAKSFSDLGGLVANTLVDKLAGMGKDGLLGLEGVVKDLPSQFFQGLGGEGGPVKEGVNSWLTYKKMSSNLIESYILPLLRDTKGGGEEVIKYTNLKNKIDREYNMIAADPKDYNPNFDGTAQEAKNEYDSLNNEAKKIERGFRKTLNPTPTPVPTPKPGITPTPTPSVEAPF